MGLLMQFVAAISSLTTLYILLCSLFLNVPSLCSFLTVGDPSFTPMQHNKQNYNFVYFYLVFLDSKREDKILLTE